MNKDQLLSELIKSGRLTIIPVGYEREGEGDEDKYQG
jgi:hypothetical protein